MRSGIHGFPWVILATMVACHAETRSSAPRLSPEEAAALVDPLTTQVLDDAPSFARGLGLHDFDGRVERVGAEAVRDQLRRAHDQLDALSAVPWERVPDPARLDLELLRLRAQRTVFALETRQEQRRILSYGELFDLSGYLQRDYAPLPIRVAAAIRHLDAASAQVDTLLSMLDPVQPRTHLLTARIIFEGLADYLQHEVLDLCAPALNQDPDLRQRFGASHAQALQKLASINRWITDALPRANEGFRLGERALLRMLEVNEGMQTDLPSLRKMAEQDFKRNHDAFVAVARQIDPALSPADVVQKVAREHLAPDAVLDAATRQLKALRTFILAHDVISIPGEDLAQVAVTPPFMRYNSAFLDAAGPFESSRESFYYITPPDPSWPAEKQEAYLPYEGDLLATSVHEVYPGHFVHALHARQAPSRAQKMFGSYAFTEGWAHYAEQMMLDVGLGGGDARIRLGQLSNALLRNCRFLATLGLHAGTMSVEEAQKLFQEQCFVDEGNAQQQAYRGTYDPGYLSYTLGKLQILALRDKFFEKRGTRSLRAFHDWLLGFGAAPVALIEKRL